MIQITNRDKKLITQNIIELRFKIEIYDENNRILDVLDGGIVGGSSAINADSDIRRTFSINVIPNKQFDVRIKEHNLIWINRKVKLYIGINDKLRNIYVWFPQGEYVFTNTFHGCVFSTIFNKQFATDGIHKKKIEGFLQLLSN